MKKNLKKTLFLLLTLCLLAGCGNTSGKDTAKASSLSYEDTINWNGQYDVVVIGFGGAGAVAAKTAAENGAKVLIVEKAPNGSEGGNTRYCGQLFAYGQGNYEDTLAYFTALAGSHQVPQEMLEVYCRGITDLADTVADMYNLDINEFTDSKNVANQWRTMSPEYPELPGSESVQLWSTNGGSSDGYLWQKMRQAIVDNSENIDVWFESPAVHLIQDPGNKTIIGVQVERGGETLNIRANNGVVMACGGFENNREMVETYLGMTQYAVMGSLYNTGDGIRMTMEVGADLWHMEVYEGVGGSLGATTVIIDEDQRINMHTSYMPPCNTGAVILVAGDGSRFLNENEIPRHGHIRNGDVYVNPSYPDTMYLIMSAQNYQTALAYKMAIPADYEYVYCADTMEELADLTGMDRDVFLTTVSNYNSYAKSGSDLQFGRSAQSMEAFPAQGPYYAVELCPVMLNTQGGARRNENAEVLGADGNPIPHLYSAGEFGGICSSQYQGGGNIAECIIFGQIAGTNAAAVKNDYESTVIKEAESDIIFVSGYETDLIVNDYSQIPLGENEYLGVGQGGMGGDIVVKATIVDGVIEAIEIVEENETPEKFAPVPKLIDKIIENQSTEVDAISGSTVSCNALVAAVQNAIENSQK